MRKKDNLVWKQQFGKFLRRFFDRYNIDYSCLADKYYWSSSTIRY